MREFPLVTIGLPFYNPGPHFVDCLKSIFAQTFVDWELILVNDGSTDNSLEVAFSVKDSRVKVVNDGKNKGLVYRLNQIASMANGKYLARMDSDDMMFPNRLERQVSYLEAHPEIDIVDTGAVILDLERNIVGERGLSCSVIDCYNALKYGVVLHPSVMARSKWFTENMYDDNYPRAEDRELFVRVIKKSKIAHINEPLYFYYYAGNVRITAFREGYKSERKVLRKYGPDLIGIPRTYLLVLRSHIKSRLLKLFVNLNMSNWITRNAYNPVSNRILHEGLAAMDIVYNTSVPGL